MTLGTSHPERGMFSPVRRETWRDATFPPGARLDSDTGDTTFAVYSKNATRVLLELYASPMGDAAQFDYWLERGSDNI